MPPASRFTDNCARSSAVRQQPNRGATAGCCTHRVLCAQDGGGLEEMLGFQQLGCLRVRTCLAPCLSLSPPGSTPWPSWESSAQLGVSLSRGPGSTRDQGALGRLHAGHQGSNLRKLRFLGGKAGAKLYKQLKLTQVKRRKYATYQL